ncbi:ATP-binding cassette domain-containing protein [Pseudocitrobacter sp. RIT415]|uniref:ATP-binding cassette domain-containing protein n=1 Tax=Pseudocitrobacter sp. RIT415 TaxID=2202163 RepID=UPI000D38E0EB|nr:ATP-binding cassette domain-containing protein [Pseudocitrobacter sp. RIT 415]RAU45590.1 ATP-binding cassette domain-containing protein [Pseudocitrobacter sp. RIT 415]
MLQINNVTLTKGQQPLLRNVSFSVQPGEIVTLMGPSGCGKSTLFSWMIGALSPAFQASGELWLNGSRIEQLPTERRRIGILFQDALLFDHLSVGHNLQLALPASMRGHQRKAAVFRALAQAGLSDFYARDPATLSGGQRARVALLRALLAQPDALLFDEPFSRLDSALRVSFRQWVFDTIRAQNIPTILVTHDPADAPENMPSLDMMRWHQTV